VRELKNAIEHALVFGKEALLTSGDFPEAISATPNTHQATRSLRSLEDLEREAIKATLEATQYKIGEAARILGISRKTLLEKRKKYGLI
jgi:DNA-binding NtrC family response regulator